MKISHANFYIKQAPIVIKNDQFKLKYFVSRWTASQY